MNPKASTSSQNLSYERVKSLDMLPIDPKTVFPDDFRNLTLIV